MPTITQKEYHALLKRQDHIERILDGIREWVRAAIDEDAIPPSVLRRWERISKDMDEGRGRSFNSHQTMKQWLARL